MAVATTTGTGPGGSNGPLASALQEIGTIYEQLGQIHRAKSYLRAAIGLRGIDWTVTADNLPNEDNRKIHGVGPGITERIAEFCKTGKLAELGKLRRDPVVKAWREFSTIVGVGPVTIREWIKAELRTLTQLRAAVRAKKVVLTDAQRWGLRYYNDLARRIPRAETAALGATLTELVKKVDPLASTEIAGSYARGQSTQGDVDLLICPQKWQSDFAQRLVAILESQKAHIATLAGGPEKITVLWQSTDYVRHLDLFYLPPDQYIAFRNYAIGSADHNQRLRGIFRKKGMLLNQKGLFRREGESLRAVPLVSEQELYQLAGIPYVEPADR